MLYIPISMIRKYVITSAPRHGNRFKKMPTSINFDGFQGLFKKVSVNLATYPNITQETVVPTKA
jgi:hypothetical protein